ncbi:MAG: metallophosphoesterase [Lachnospiraceae bacterium]|nr:metallophosphoesterase [Lachnospiraceae bacterium]
MKKLLLLTFTIVFMTAAACGDSFSTKPYVPSATAADITSATEVSPVPAVQDEACIHKDTDNNGLCDLCNADVLAVIDIYALNDLHGKFKDSDAQPGVDEMTAWLKTRQMLDDNFVILSSGDMWQGSSESNLTRGNLVTEWMNDLDFVSMTFGNHEYDWGREYIEKNEELAEFPFLAINIYEKATKSLASYCTPSVVIEREGVKIGIIGAIGDCYSSISGKMVSDVYFLTGADLTRLVKAEAERLRKEEGCKIIVYSVHDGYSKNVSGTGTIAVGQLSSYFDPTLSDGYVDVVFEGHTHKAYALKDFYGVWHLQGGGDNTTGLSHVCMEYNKANDTLVTSEAGIVSHNTYKYDQNPDPIVETLLAKYDDVIGDINAVIANIPERMDGDELRQLCAVLYYDAAMERWGDKYDIALAGGYFSIRSPRSLAAGEVTYSDLQMLFPFDNQLVLCECKGIDLNNNFFETTNDNYFINYGEYGEEVKNHLAPNAVYYLVTDTYSSSYGPNHLTEVELYDADVFARDLLADYFKEKYGVK